MGFSAKQTQALRRNLDHRYVRTRESNGRELSYIGGWYAISEANRIFGFDGWNRETIESRCVLARENRGTFIAVYIARVRITVNVGDSTIVREGHGTGEGRGATPGEVHDTALKGAETDATKRALATFGKPFGLSLYEHGKLPAPAKALSPVPQPAITPAPQSVETGRRISLARDDTTPIPRPSNYYGREKYLETRTQPPHNLLAKPESEPGQKPEQKSGQQQASGDISIVPAVVPAPEDMTPGRIDKSLLTLSEPKRRRDKAHLRFVASQPCLVCGRQPSDPHHLRFAQPRALGLKVSDEFTVPLCRGHHRQLHQAGNEVAWWENLKIDALAIAKGLWDETHGRNPSADTLSSASAPVNCVSTKP
jgi:Rad52/22 family double-strand break repair protein